jgi:hypothetical protein
MKNLLFLLLTFGVFASKGQTTVTLMLPDNCNVSTGVEKPIKTFSGMLNITPNPNRGSFYLYAEFKSEIGKLSISISDLNGQEVYSERMYCDSKMFVKQVDAGMLPAGTYVVKLEAKETSLFGKMIITK